ncbi:DUF1176 domain-containing protein [Cucumibacter marinus]|uniref:DUF1176 domain-containing protein n=1 Tax=Cucumibacter marinus TaxID=1121252 RepID=UPI0003FA1F4F|nr:DUF1176 domain-containing protein [Cucumibacter marinus]
MFRPLTRFALTIACLFALAWPGLAQPFGETRRYFDDWLAACRPTTDYCSATAYVNVGAGGRVADHILRVGRHPDAPYWEVSFTAVIAMPAETSVLNIAIDDAELNAEPGRDYAAFGAINDYFLMGDAAQFTLDHLVPGNTARFAFTDDQGTPHEAAFSLRGLAASLLWIDEQQRRVGAERVAGADPKGLERVGQATGPNGSLPAALLQQHAASGTCDPMQDVVHADWGEVHDLGETTKLYIVPCTSHAYNVTFRLYVARAPFTSFEPLYFADYSEALGWTGTDRLFNIAFEPETNRLSAFYKGRGLADCGTAGNWVWSDYAFKLESYYAKDECDGDFGGEFPQVYP